MKTIALALLAALPLFAAPPVVTEKGGQIEITVPAGNTAVWVAFAGDWFTGTATDTDRDGRILIDAEQFGFTWIVADAQTGEWTIEGRMSQAPLPPGTILPVTGGRYGVIVLPPKYMGGALWIRPGVGVWAPTTRNLVAFPSGQFANYIEPTPQFAWRGVTSTAAPPAEGFRRGDVLLVMSRLEALTGTVDAQLDAAPNPGVISFDHEMRDFTEGRTNLYLDIVRTLGTAGTVTVRCCAVSGSAAAGVDFTPPPVQDYVFAPGEYYKHISFPLHNDDKYTQGLRDVRLTWISVNGAPVEHPTQTVLRIHDDERAPSVAWGEFATSYPETDTPWTLQIPVRLSGTPIRGTFQVDVEVSSPRLGTRTVPVLFNEGETQAMAAIPIPADDVGSAPHEITLRISNLDRRFVTIVDDDLPQMVLSKALMVRENFRSATVQVTIEPEPPSAVSFTVATVAGTAQPGSDFEPIGPRKVTTNGPRGISIDIIEDRIPEGPETFYVDITAVTGPVAPPQVTRVAVTIVDDDTAYPIIDVAPARVYEGNSGPRKVPVRVRLSKAMPEPVTLYVTTIEDRARWSDFLLETRMVTFPAGVTEASTEVTVYGDTERGESDELFSLRVTWDGLLVAWGSVTILDDDDFPPTIVALDVNAFEKTGTSSAAVFHIHIARGAQVAGSVRYSTADGSAKAGLDYVATSGTAHFAAGAQAFDIPVEIVGDGISEPTEDFFLKIEGQPEWLTLPGSQTSIRATVYDDDSPQAPHRLRVSDADVVEGDDWREAVFTVTLSRPATQTVTASYSTQDGTATAPLDYEARSGTLTFAPGQTAQEVRVRIAGDQENELLETFELLISSSTPVEDGRGAGIIHDDEITGPRRRTSRH
jgi:hypothetical protein